jgi:phage-related protein
MRISRKEEQMWHFSEPEHCGWAQTFVEEDEFEESIEVSSLDKVTNFCSMCRERRE